MSGSAVVVPGGPQDEDGSMPAETGRRASGRRGSVMVLVASVVALVVAVSGLLAWRAAASGDEGSTARARDAVTVAANRGIATLNSLDYRDVDAGLDAWVAVSTGALADQLAGISAENRKLLEEAGKISTGNVLEAAVVDLDKTTATVIAAVEVTVADGTDADAEPAVKRNRFSADMVLVKGEWKVENLQQVPVNLR